MPSLRLPRPHPEAVRFVPFFVGINLIAGIHMPFFPAWLASVDFDPESIGLLMMGMGIVRVATGPLLGLLADAFAARRLALIALMGLAAFSYSGYQVLPGAAFVVLFSLTSSIAFSAIRPMLDGVIVRSALRHQFDYGRVVMFGSAAFIAMNFASGILVAQTGIDVFLTVVIGAGFYAFAMSFFLPSEPVREHPVNLGGMWTEAKALVRQPIFILFVGAAGFSQASHAFYYGFGTLNWKAQGFSADLIGALWALGVLAEIVLFAMSNRAVARVGPIGLIAAGCVAGLIRWTVLALSPPLWVVVLVQVLHAGTFAATHLGAVHFIARAVPPHLVATGQSLYSAIMIGVFMAGGQYASGHLYAEHGALGYLLMTATSAVALGLSLLLSRLWSGQALALNGRSA